MIKENNLDNGKNNQLNQDTFSSSFVNIKLRRDIVKGMISTYEFLVWNNTGEERKDCQKILKALKKSISR